MTFGDKIKRKAGASVKIFMQFTGFAIAQHINPAPFLYFQDTL
ncbi:MAG: hypothetical protein BWX73_01527 [Lentisphaerae bacterium ADurb.Bin082]|nr:MAG: hypothetical protein BWX73_01527 [Lentisphaerae bacterium ADurb.Bin082]